MPFSHIFYIIAEVLIAVTATLGNALVISVVRLIPAYQNTTFYFIASLALADIAVGVLVAPLAVVVKLEVVLHFYACLFTCCILMIFCHASIMSLLAIATDRYLRVKLAVRYKAMVTQRRIWVALSFCWITALLVGLVPMFGWNLKKPENSIYLNCSYKNVMSMDYVVYFSFFSWILVPLLIMCALYSEIFYILQTKLKQKSTSIKGTGILYGREFKMIKSLVLVLFLFILCWLPLIIINSVLHFCPTCDVPQSMLDVAILLSHANSSLNPIVYALRIKRFRKMYVLVLKTYVFCLKQKSDVFKTENSSSDQVIEDSISPPPEVLVSFLPQCM